MDAQGIYRLCRDAGYTIETQKKMKGVIVHITDPGFPDQFAGAFGNTEEAAWKHLANDWNEGDFWRKEPE